ncbi:hypothetical protein MTR_0039s0090 [Medicago truncatula]|uniref:Uncharacterized protein n=1 Tax=Medicago truncatula TaxID=3880 RepID=A0A072TUA5_MEDTR|nr:hypothetical protein MTR_0039s0090 [Medicago truncatula]
MSLIKDLEKSIRNFIWSGSIDKRKLVTVAWKKICKPTAQGGLGIRSLQKLNQAANLKLCRDLFHNKEDWVGLICHTPNFDHFSLFLSILFVFLKSSIFIVSDEISTKRSREFYFDFEKNLKTEKFRFPVWRRRPVGPANHRIGAAKPAGEDEDHLLLFSRIFREKEEFFGLERERLREMKVDEPNLLIYLLLNRFLFHLDRFFKIKPDFILTVGSPILWL